MRRTADLQGSVLMSGLLYLPGVRDLSGQPDLLYADGSGVGDLRRLDHMQTRVADLRYSRNMHWYADLHRCADLHRLADLQYDCYL